MFFSKFKKKILGFTFLEIIVSVAIVAILASISIIATTRVRIKSRDIKRISNATEIVSALEAYYAANQSYPTMIFPGQPIESNGREYLRAVPSNPFPRTDGGCADSDYTYVTTTTGYKLTFCIGSDNSRFAQGVVICKNGNCGIKEDCSGEVQDEEGIRYPIVRIGEQCWMAMHLKSKRNPNGTCVNVPDGANLVDANCLTVYGGNFYGGFSSCPGTGCTYASRRDCIKISGPIIPGPGWGNRGYDIAEAYDYPPGPDSACNNRGALFTWMGAMNLPNEPCNRSTCSHLISPLHRGVCPVNWHIPTDSEFHTLESNLTDSNENCNANRNNLAPGSDSCRSAGLKMVESGPEKFNATLLGYRTGFSEAEFFGIDENVYFWTTTNGAIDFNNNYFTAFSRMVKSGVNGTYRAEIEKWDMATVRCIRDY